MNPYLQSPPRPFIGSMAFIIPEPKPTNRSSAERSWRVVVATLFMSFNCLRVLNHFYLRSRNVRGTFLTISSWEDSDRGTHDRSTFWLWRATEITWQRNLSIGEVGGGLRPCFKADEGCVVVDEKLRTVGHSLPHVTESRASVRSS